MTNKSYNLLNLQSAHKFSISGILTSGDRHRNTRMLNQKNNISSFQWFFKSKKTDIDPQASQIHAEQSS